jgi:hypothetical protein
MKHFGLITLTLVTTALFAACGAPADNKPAANNSNAANANTAKPVATAPTKEALMTMEKAGWEAWKNRNAKWTEENASDKYVGFSSTGRMDKAASIKTYTEQKCEIKSYSLSDDQMQMVGPDVAVLTFKSAQDYTCDGKKGPTNVNSASIYIREGDKWKAAFYAETPVVDPKAPPKPAPAKKDEAKKEEAKPDTATDAVLAVEKKIWEAWKAKDPKALEGVLAKDFMFTGGQGRRDRATIIKEWATESKCEVKSFTLSDAASASIAKDVTILTYKGGGEGTCEGQPIMTEWYVSVYTKEGDAWRQSFGMGVSQ